MKYLPLVSVALVLGGCATIDAAVQRACNTEERLHSDYVAFVAPFRTADKQALELANYTSIKAACLTNDPFKVLFSLVNAAKSLRK